MGDNKNPQTPRPDVRPVNRAAGQSRALISQRVFDALLKRLVAAKSWGTEEQVRAHLLATFTIYHPGDINAHT